MPSTRWKPKQYALIAIGFLLVHGICNLTLSNENALALSYVFGFAAPIYACATCFRAGYQCSQTGGIRTGWFLFGAGVLLWALGMALAAWEDLTHQVAFAVTYFSDFTYFMYGAPILLAISSAKHHRRSLLFQWLDAIQVLLAAFLIYIVIFSVSPFTKAVIDPIPISLFVKTYNIENLVLACCATLRLIAHRRTNEEGRYYLALTVFLWVYGVLAGTYNDLSLDAPEGFGLRELLPDIPFLLLPILAFLPVGKPDALRDELERDSTLTLFIDNFSPIFFTAALLGLGFAVLRAHFYTGVLAVSLALAVHSLRSTTLQNRYMRSERALREARDKLERLSLTDALTEVSNRRCFDQMLEMEWNRAMRSQSALSLLMIDIDFFKSLNDEYGHPHGDACLIKIAEALRSTSPRSGDLLARYGGEEFAVLLPNTERAGAELLAAKMQEAVVSLGIDYAPDRRGPVTVSIGVTTCVDFNKYASADLVASADHGLYRAKENGRNRVEFHEM